ncbi:hypothetical protein Tco_1134017 [Tanacetum coccineum]
MIHPCLNRPYSLLISELLDTHQLSDQILCTYCNEEVPTHIRHEWCNSRAQDRRLGRENHGGYDNRGFPVFWEDMDDTTEVDGILKSLIFGRCGGYEVGLSGDFTLMIPGVHGFLASTHGVGVGGVGERMRSETCGIGVLREGGKLCVRTVEDVTLNSNSGCALRMLQRERSDIDIYLDLDLLLELISTAVQISRTVLIQDTHEFCDQYITVCITEWSRPEGGISATHLRTWMLYVFRISQRMAWIITDESLGCLDVQIWQRFYSEE